jgi:hypothetical protein
MKRSETGHEPVAIFCLLFKLPMFVATATLRQDTPPTVSGGAGSEWHFKLSKYVIFTTNEWG